MANLFYYFDGALPNANNTAPSIGTIARGRHERALFLFEFKGVFVF
jgi:hypothetical protein